MSAMDPLADQDKVEKGLILTVYGSLQFPTKCRCNNLHFWIATTYIFALQLSAFIFCNKHLLHQMEVCAPSQTSGVKNLVSTRFFTLRPLFKTLICFPGNPGCISPFHLPTASTGRRQSTCPFSRNRGLLRDVNVTVSPR